MEDKEKYSKLKSFHFVCEKNYLLFSQILPSLNQESIFSFGLPMKNSKLNETQIWVYIIDLTPSQMIEYGAILPESGGEAKWFKSLSPILRRKLKKMESN